MPMKECKQIFRKKERKKFLAVKKLQGMLLRKPLLYFLSGMISMTKNNCVKTKLSKSFANSALKVSKSNSLQSSVR